MGAGLPADIQRAQSGQVSCSAANACFTTHHSRVKSDSIELQHGKPLSCDKLLADDSCGFQCEIHMNGIEGEVDATIVSFFQYAGV
jgi:hypothetical protein